VTWNPIFPVWLVALIGVLLVGFAVWRIIAASRRRERLGWILRAAAALLIVVACFRPGIGSAGSPTLQSGVDIVFVVDTTSSMNAEDEGTNPDGSPRTRLEAVRDDVASLAEQHVGARFSVISFDSSAVQRLPFTTDTTALRSIMTTLRSEVTLYSKGSSITIAKDLLAQVLQRAEEKNPDHAQIVYYLGDGEQTSNDKPASFGDAARFVDGGAVLGYGTTEGGRMKENGGPYGSDKVQYIQDPAGGDALSKIDEGNLRAIAGDLRVDYAHRDPGTPVTAAQVDPGRLSSTAGGDVEHSFDLYWILLILAFGALLPDAVTVTRGIAELRHGKGSGA